MGFEDNIEKGKTSSKPTVASKMTFWEAMKNIERQLHQIEEDREKLFVEYSK
ncbi:MAG: hypothetical protein UR39_C0001G0162 [Candidatus Woesebacteria bacterium GW2011_GWA1_33_30]|uniref:Uncharacterized protein n=1 Tax=Candidatus Woesebacteria bacterium GW2011_GWA2_33_28 TaxID=1618561 RepID=A0A0G0CYD0_9BACT|nr:MAG: hypothetical protein UR38_C0001G0163 [Candidatus Woesebacteria bacterium GW2011_GWA2_33_28]KKP49129.1 MAG: hypothetical protein UR39_C0001G0162 [Candidatus Woesebacteria bacterium GW2011_GWA1_33_30]KKP50271.1 MAG: hypothetical protein UR40_C0001G0013 [Microgenomates group bacterium GW2011_GWC1_33_32]KKP52720.1 MAG: hypothetical protein UR44_C0001G0162 [Candidatus Woesebacteria bacterium GW2011_GWB1_33_38]